MKLADYDFSRHAGDINSVYIVMNGNDVDMYLNNGIHFLTVEPKVAQLIVKLMHSYNIRTKDDLFKMDWSFCLHLSFIGNYVLYDEHRKVLSLTK